MNKQQNGDVRNKDQGAYLKARDSANTSEPDLEPKVPYGFRPIVT